MGRQRGVTNWPLGDISPMKYDEAKAHAIKLRRHLLAAAPQCLDLDLWNGDLSKQRINMSKDGLTIECFGVCSRESKLFVFLSSGRSRKGENATRFERVSWYPWFNGVCLFIEDPTRKSISSNITAGWYFGSEKIHALPIVAAIVRKVQSKYGIANEDTHFIGSSSGGFAALWLADFVVGAIGFAGNPQYYVARWPDSKRFAMEQIDLTNPEFEKRVSLEHLSQNHRSRFFSQINAKSKNDYEDQLVPLLESWGLSPVSYGLNNYGNFSVYCRSIGNDGANSTHHAFDNVQEFRLIFNAIKFEYSIDARADALNIVHEMQSERLSLQDRILYSKVWTVFFSKIRLPIVVPWDALDGKAAKFTLRNSNRRLYYHVVWGGQAKHAFISLRAKQRDRELAPVFEELATAGYGRHFCKNGTRILTIGKSNYEVARVRFTSFVKQTTPFLYAALDLHEMK
ncbi:hypothetical protein PsAD5_00547 [Pseudovibrio sp. Ad5]|nr:hypothetical protein PsAD5_00547 [Pseudovibrio sp. Ad5]